MTAEEIQAVEAGVNADILADYPVNVAFPNYKNAVASGPVALAHIQAERAELNRIATKLGVKPTETAARVDWLLAQLHDHEKEIKHLKRKLARADFERHLQQVKSVNGISVLATQVTVDDTALLREMGDWFRDKLGSGVIVLVAVDRIWRKPAAKMLPNCRKRWLWWKN